eukprot:scaffold9622_cov113-Isochrysis_galbana.AAC.1
MWARGGAAQRTCSLSPLPPIEPKTGNAPFEVGAPHTRGGQSALTTQAASTRPAIRARQARGTTAHPNATVPRPARSSRSCGIGAEHSTERIVLRPAPPLAPPPSCAALVHGTRAAGEVSGAAVPVSTAPFLEVTPTTASV